MRTRDASNLGICALRLYARLEPRNLGLNQPEATEEQDFENRFADHAGVVEQRREVMER